MVRFAPASGGTPTSGGYGPPRPPAMVGPPGLLSTPPCPACLPQGARFTLIRPIGSAGRRRLVGSRWATTGADRGDGVSERSPAAIAHAGVFDQRHLDEFTHIGRQVGWQRRWWFLDVLHRHRQRAVARERPLTRNR